jgi:hypothetical protein
VRHLDTEQDHVVLGRVVFQKRDAGYAYFQCFFVSLCVNINNSFSYERN